MAICFAIRFMNPLLRTFSPMRLSGAIKTGTWWMLLLLRPKESLDRAGI